MAQHPITCVVRSRLGCRGQVHTAKNTHSKKHAHTYQDPHTQDRPHQPQTPPTTAQKKQMRQHQHLHKFTSLPKTILVLYLYVYFHVNKSMHSNLATQNTNPTDPDHQPTHAHTRNLRNINNHKARIYNPQQTATSPNANQMTQQHNHVFLNSHLYYCNPQNPNHLCRKKERTWRPTACLHSIRATTKMQTVAAKERRPQQAKERRPRSIVTLRAYKPAANTEHTRRTASLVTKQPPQKPHSPPAAH